VVYHRIRVAFYTQIFRHDISRSDKCIGADEGTGNALVFQRDGVVHTARAARASVTDTDQREVATPGDQVDQIRRHHTAGMRFLDDLTFHGGTEPLFKPIRHATKHRFSVGLPLPTRPITGAGANGLRRAIEY